MNNKLLLARILKGTGCANKKRSFNIKTKDNIKKCIFHWFNDKNRPYKGLIFFNFLQFWGKT